jgi:hypothetical protein
MNTEKATLTFPSRALAHKFALKWSYATLEGHDVSATGPDGVTKVTIYKITPNRKEMINSFVSELTR